MTSFRAKPNLISNLISTQQAARDTDTRQKGNTHTGQLKSDGHGEDLITTTRKASRYTTGTDTSNNNNTVPTTSISGYHSIVPQPDYRSISIGDIVLDESEMLSEEMQMHSVQSIDSIAAFPKNEVSKKVSKVQKKVSKKVNKKEKETQKQTQRKKSSRSCDYCRLKKVRCFFVNEKGVSDSNGKDGQKQCENCVKNGLECTFTRVQLKRGPGAGTSTSKAGASELSVDVAVDTGVSSSVDASTVRDIVPNVSISPNADVPASAYKVGKSAAKRQSKKLKLQKEAVPSTAFQQQEPYNQPRGNSIGSASGVALPPLSSFPDTPSETRGYTNSNNNNTTAISTTNNATNHTYSPSPSLTTPYAYSGGFSSLLPNGSTTLSGVNYNINMDTHRGSITQTQPSGPPPHTIESATTRFAHTPTSPPHQQFWKVPYNRRDSIVSLTSGISSSSERSSNENEHTNFFANGLVSGMNVEKLLLNLNSATPENNNPSRPHSTAPIPSTINNRDGVQPASATGDSPRQQQQMNNIFLANPMLQAFLEHQQSVHSGTQQPQQQQQQQQHRGATQCKHPRRRRCGGNYQGVYKHH
ncbi:hypothetical protein ACO0RG_000125 [Hanseniaspora osmophila]